MRKSSGVLVLLLIIFSVCKAQDKPGSPIITSFRNYHSSVFQEKTFVHSDQDAYLAGELLWFKVYNTDAATNSFSTLSKVAYVELIDASRTPVLQAKVALQEGIGNGSLFLPVSLASGNYVLRAYTGWMKNFSSDLFFEKDIRILNSTVPPVTERQAAAADFDVQFFPEGGNLVHNAENKVAFRVAGRNGLGVNFRGAIVDMKNDTVAYFGPHKFGMGNFTLSPRLNETYRAVIAIAGLSSPVIKELPPVSASGYGLRVESAGEKVNIKIYKGSTTSDRVYLFVHNKKTITSFKEGTLLEGSGSFSVDIGVFKEGVSYITVFDASYRPVAERLYFKRPEKALVVRVSPDNPAYTTRAPVSLNIDAITRDTLSKVNLSLAVYKVDSLSMQVQADIFQYHWLTSELQGRIENPGYYFSRASAETDLALDNLLLSHGWRRFKWDDVLKMSNPTFNVVPEFEGHIVNGKVTDKRSGKAAPGIMTFLSVASKRTQIYTSRSDEKGGIKFFTRDLMGPNELIVQTNVLQDSTYSIQIDNPFSESSISRVPPVIQFSSISPLAIQERYVSAQVQNAFVAEELRKFKSFKTDNAAFYGRPENVYVLNEFVRFRTVEEVLREYVPSVVVQRQRNNFNLIVDKKTATGLVGTVPLIILDGVPVFDRGNKVIAYDQAKLERIEVTTKNSFLGDTTFNSVVNFTTFKGNLESFELDARDLVIDYEGLQLQREFFSPVYESSSQQSSRLPDMRQLLYWAPGLTLTAGVRGAVNFYTSDQTGKYIVVLQGMTASGDPGSGTASFEVK